MYRPLNISVPGELDDQGFSLQKNKNDIFIIGHDFAKRMYGLPELTDQVYIAGIKNIKPSRGGKK